MTNTYTDTPQNKDPYPLFSRPATVLSVNTKSSCVIKTDLSTKHKTK
jgi:hypothetical protein